MIDSNQVNILNTPIPIDGGNPTPVGANVLNFPVTQPVSIAGVVSVITALSSSATVTQVAQSNSVDTVLLAANANRKSAILFIPKSGVSIKYGAGASATSFTTKTGVTNNTVTIVGYSGQINSFGPADTINVTELV